MALPSLLLNKDQLLYKNWSLLGRELGFVTCNRIWPLYMLSGNMVAHIMNAVTIAQKLSAMNDWLAKKTTTTTITMVT